LGKKRLIIELAESITTLPESLSSYALELSDDGNHLTYTYDTMSDSTGITTLLQDISTAGLSLKDLQTKQSSLEDIFVELVKKKA
jgi:ABC-2 type transport system ATP-binding protein